MADCQSKGQSGQDQNIGHAYHCQDVGPSEAALSGVKVSRVRSAHLSNGRISPTARES